MIKVRVRNVQSIKDAELEIDGFTVLTGPNNSGKSAFVRAFRGVWENSPARTLVRRGEKTLTVDVELDDHTVTWRKGKGLTEYEIDGVPLGTVGSQCPQPVRDLGISSITAGGKEVWPQIAPQFDGTLFLTNLPGSVLAEAVSDVERVGTLNGALKLSEKDYRAAASKLKIRKEDAQTLSDELQEFEGLDGYEDTLTQIEDAQNHVNKIRSAVLWVEEHKETFDGVSALISRLLGFTIRVPEAPNVAPILVEHQEVSRQREISVRLIGQIEQLEDLLPELNSIATSPKVLALDKVGDKIQSLGQAANKIASVEASLPEVRRLEKFLDTGEVQILLPGEVKVRKAVKAYGMMVEHQRLLDSFREAEQTLHGLLAREQKVCEELSETEREVEVLLAELQVCPTCGTSTEKSHGQEETSLH